MNDRDRRMLEQAQVAELHTWQVREALDQVDPLPDFVPPPDCKIPSGYDFRGSVSQP